MVWRCRRCDHSKNHWSVCCTRLHSRTPCNNSSNNNNTDIYIQYLIAWHMGSLVFMVFFLLFICRGRFSYFFVAVVVGVQGVRSSELNPLKWIRLAVWRGISRVIFNKNWKWNIEYVCPWDYFHFLFKREKICGRLKFWKPLQTFRYP